MMAGKIMGRYLRWFVGLITAILLAVLILFAPIPSIMRWQSPLISRSFLWLILVSFLPLYRIMRGPTTSDRAIAIVVLGILIVGFCAILSISTGREWYIDIGLAWAIQSFVGMLAISKFLEGRDFDE